jgi:hypothetical protein
MDTKLFDILNGKCKNYLLPFFWQHGDHTDKLPEQIQTIYDSGCRAFCVESRPHPDFAGEGWWRDMDIILAEAKKRGMKVWLLDDDKFPTGHAAGLIASKYPDLRQWNVAERHIDICGPMKDGAVLASATGHEHILLGVFAYRRRHDHDEICELEAIDLTANIKDGCLYWDVPEGLWRIFFYYKTRQGIMKDYIDMTRAESVHALIEAVYETHYQHYKEYFGNTFAGFFSDEPCFGNEFRYGVPKLGFVGKRGFRLPWNDDLIEIMRNKLGYDPIPHLNLLWFEDGQNGDFQSEFRYAYMDAITDMYSHCFNKQLADWCADHGVMYIGHVIEEAATAVGAGHFFKSTRWQHMSGIDVVLHSVMPGMDNISHSSSGAAGFLTSDFSHYALAKLGASLAHIEPRTKGRSMCEALGAYGWAEDTTVMKYILDHFMVRGINHFVPHAFDSKFPDPDCPPHFGIEGKDPSFDGFTALMGYTNKVCHLLYNTKHIAKTAIFYPYENDWASRFDNAMTIEKVAVPLYDAHIDFHIVPHDYLGADKISDGKLCLGEEQFECLVIPYADHISADVAKTFNEMQAKGLTLIFVNDKPENVEIEGKIIALESLAEELTAMGMGDVVFESGFDKVRVYHCQRDGNDIFMFANEERFAVNTTVKLPCRGKYAKLDIANDLICGGTTETGEIALVLEPSQSILFVFGDCEGLPNEPTLVKSVAISPEFDLALADYEDLNHFVDAGHFDRFFNVSGADFKPTFSGKMRYTFKIDAEKGKRIILDLGRVGTNAKLNLNGVDLGVRFTAPYIFDVTDVIREGENDVIVTVGNTLAQKIRDRFSFNMLVAPAGLLGDITIKYFN